MTDLKNRIGSRIRLARKDRGLTQEKLAEKIGKAVETVSNIERGNTFTGIATLEAIAKALKTPVRDFFDEPGETRKLSKKRIELEHQLRRMVPPLSDDHLQVAIDLVASLIKQRKG